MPRLPRFAVLNTDARSIGCISGDAIESDPRHQSK
jgi:hypothetical protein